MVQPLLVTELVFALVLRRIWIHQPIRRTTWWAAGWTCITLGVFLAMSEPQGGSSSASGSTWIAATAATAVLAGALALGGWHGPPAHRAALLACATSMLWALVAAFMKLMTESLSTDGFGGMFAHWPVYALAATGLVAEVLNQVTLHVGPLSYSQPFLVAVDPVVSIALSVWIFDESFTPHAGRLAVAAVAFAGMIVAVLVLLRTAPRTMEAAVSPG